MPIKTFIVNGKKYAVTRSNRKGKNNIKSANFWSRKMWTCRGKKSVKK